MRLVRLMPGNIVFSREFVRSQPGIPVTGCPEMGFGDYASMQEQLAKGYMDIAHGFSIRVAPVGAAWKKVVDGRRKIALWERDGIHPGPAGTYLAACVFYATLTRKSPEGNKFTAGLPPADAAYLQKVAAETVLADPKAWKIP
jgi:hypothetical protein